MEAIQLNLLEPELLQAQELSIEYCPNFLSPDKAAWLLEVSKTLQWQQNRTKMFGKDLGNKPRLETMYGDKGCDYVYSKNVVLNPLPWTKELLWLREKVEQATGHKYAIVIGNWYRSGNDSIGWHDDGRPFLGANPAIASVTLGAVRRFSIKPKTQGARSIHFDLESGSLLFMKPGCQSSHVHQVPKTKAQVGDRINWTFRPHVGSLTL